MNNSEKIKTKASSNENFSSDEAFVLSILNTPKQRIFCDNLNNQKVNLICLLKDLDEMIEFVQKFKNLSIKKIYLLGSDKEYPKNVDLLLTEGISTINVLPLSELNIFGLDMISEQESFFCFINSAGFDGVFQFSYVLLKKGLLSFKYYCPVVFESELRSDPQINFLTENYKNLKDSYNLLKNDDSKNTFASAIKSIICGNSDYMKSSINKQYYSEFVFPEENDVIIDAGVSPYIETTVNFSKTAGKCGQVYSFEPEPSCYKYAKEQIEMCSDIENVQIFEYGLWNESTELEISANGDGSSIIYNDGKPRNMCKVCKLDDFIKEHKIKKVDFIKLDIESAEPEAIEGALDTIRTFKPKLAISVYHCRKHLFELILFINSLNLGYEFYMEQHSLTMYEVVLYAKAEN